MYFRTLLHHLLAIHYFLCLYLTVIDAIDLFPVPSGRISLSSAALVVTVIAIHCFSCLTVIDDFHFFPITVPFDLVPIKKNKEIFWFNGDIVAGVV